MALAGLIYPGSLFALDPEKRLTQFVHTAWTPRDGAPSDISYIAQTPDGYLWLGSQFTTFRFDGARFLPWNPPTEWAHLTERGLRGALFVSRDGTLWMGLAEGIARIRDDKFAWHKVGADTNSITGIAEEDDEHLLLVVKGSGLHRFNRRTGQSSRLSQRDGFLGGLPMKVWQDRDGTIWANEGYVWKGATGYRVGVDRDIVPYSTEHTILYKPRGERTFRPTGLKVGEVGGFAQGADGAIWLVETARSVRVLRTRAGRWLPPDPEIHLGSVSAIFDRHGSLWVTSMGDGLNRVANPEAFLAGRARQVEDYTEEHGLSGDVLYVSFEDREGNLWFGGPNGLDRFRDVRLAELTAQEGVRLNMSAATIVPDDGGVAVASFVLNGVVMRIDRAGALSSQHVYVDRSERLGRGCAAAGANPVLAMSRAPDGVLWAAGTRLYRRAGKDSEWRCIPLRIGAETPVVNALTTDGAGGVWLGTRKGLWRYAADGTLTRVEATRSYFVTVMLAQADGTIWFGGDGGLAKLQGDGRVVAIAAAGDLPRGGVYGLFDAGRAGRGDVGVLDRNGLRIVRGDRLVKPPGLSATPLAGCWFATRADADLWFTCAHGLVRIPGAEWDALAANLTHVPAHELFDATDDLRSAPIRGGTAGSIARSDDGRIWFVTRKGVGYLDPARIDRTRHPPPVYIDAARSGNQSIDVKATAVRLEPVSQPLDISFTGISLGHPERLRFRYRLEGIDSDWRETRERTVSYSHVPAGDYRLRVMAIDHQGTPSEREAVWSFSVAPRWYERWWVGPSAIALTALMVWGVARVGMARQAVRLKREFSLQLAERTRIARELHDTLLQTVQGSKMLADEALLQTGDPEKVRSAVAQLSEWLALAVGEGRAALNSLRTSNADVKDLAEVFRRAADTPAKPSAMTVSVSVRGDAMILDPLVQHQVYRVGYEAMRNAFAHSAGTRLEVAIEYAHDLILRVTDNGEGIDPAVLRRGKSGRFGLHGMNERARSIGATLTIDSSTSGTSVTLLVPRRRATEA